MSGARASTHVNRVPMSGRPDHPLLYVQPKGPFSSVYTCALLSLFAVGLVLAAWALGPIALPLVIIPIVIGVTLARLRHP
jgi:hypothetical protein